MEYLSLPVSRMRYIIAVSILVLAVFGVMVVNSAVAQTLPAYPSNGGVCTGSPSSLDTGESATWAVTTYPSYIVYPGWTVTRNYYWLGTDAAYGSLPNAQSVSKQYDTAGTKEMSVMVNTVSGLFVSGAVQGINCGIPFTPGCGGSIPSYATLTCTPAVTVTVPEPVASCSASPTTARTGETVTWTGVVPADTVSYFWAGTDGLAQQGVGNNPVIGKSYTSAGTKYAQLTYVIPGDGTVSGPVGSTIAIEGGLGGISGLCSVSYPCGGGGVTLPSIPFDVRTVECSNTVTVTTLPQCSDGLDSDGDNDGTDYGTDPGCTSPDDPIEGDNPECSDDINNDDGEDVLIDDGNDPGCYGPTDPTESPNPSGPGAPPFAYIEAIPDRVNNGDHTTLGWSAENVTSCTVTGTNGLSPITAVVNGSFIVATTTASSGNITTQSVFTISCTPSVSDSVMVNVNPGVREF